jgi:hypothetical protein
LQKISQQVPAYIHPPPLAKEGKKEGGRDGKEGRKEGREGGRKGERISTK